MIFFIFSYNRGQFLRHCVATIEQCAPGNPVIVFDDNSRDPETVEVLNTIAQTHQVLKPSAQGQATKHGGLYANMQAAYKLACLHHTDELVCFIQDDTQLTRAISAQEILHIKQYYTHNDQLGFVQPAFIRGLNRPADHKLTRYDAQNHVYYIDRMKRSAGAFYSDICLFIPSRLQAKGWEFALREAANEHNARTMFAQMPYLGNPFAAWLPNVPAFRGKGQNWAMRKAHALNCSGFYPINILEGDKLDAFLRRTDQSVPYAEDFLTAPGNKVTPWIYYPLQNKKILKKLSHAQAKLQNMLGKGQ